MLATCRNIGSFVSVCQVVDSRIWHSDHAILTTLVSCDGSLFTMCYSMVLPQVPIW